MSNVSLAIQTWPEIREDFGANWFIYLSMPFVAALVGWITKVVALQMLYSPLEYRGIGPIGWQGVMPRRAGKVASKSMEALTTNVLKAEELLERFDADELVDALHEPLVKAVDEMARDIAEQVAPGLWDFMPDVARNAVQAHVRAQAPRLTERLLNEMKSDIRRYVDIQYLAVSTLVRNKEKLVSLMKVVSKDALAFVRRSGIYFGLVIGLVQMVAWAVFQNPWIMPAFGFGVGLISDWLALTMLFRPLEPKKFLGFIPFQGLLLAQREVIIHSFAKILAEDLFSPETLFDAVLTGPGSEKLVALVAKEVEAAIDDQVGAAVPLATLAFGTKRYRDVKDGVITRVKEVLPTTVMAARDYTTRVIDLENTIADKMNQLSNREYESMFRPVFKDDEPLMVAVGAILGGLVGEIQVQLIHLFAR
ncbi:hypothetical protein A5721_13965 [Mycobacterium vulneris]|nr:hypothetical protein A5721_13965 [Mycolicibacterium vulneris]